MQNKSSIAQLFIEYSQLIRLLENLFEMQKRSTFIYEKNIKENS